MRIFGSSPARRLNRGALLGGALLAAVWGWTLVDSRQAARTGGSAVMSDVMPVHLSLGFKRTRKLAYQRWMSAHKDAADPNGMEAVAGTFSAGGKTFVTRVRASGKNSFALDLARGDSWNGARSLRLVRQDSAEEPGTQVELNLNGHSEGRYVLTEAPTVNKMLRQGRRLGALFHLDSSGKLTSAEEAEDNTNPVFEERRREALAKVEAKDPSMFADPALVQAREKMKRLVVYYDPDLGRLLPVGPEESARQ